jgi:hypothetical protein
MNSTWLRSRVFASFLLCISACKPPANATGDNANATDDTSEQSGNIDGPMDGNDQPVVMLTAQQQFVRDTIVALKAAGVLTPAQGDALEPIVNAELDATAAGGATLAVRGTQAFSKLVPSGVSLESYMPVVWSRATLAAGGESVKLENFAALLSAALTPHLASATNVQLLGRAMVKFGPLTAASLAPGDLFARGINAQLTTSGDTYKDLLIGAGAALML